VGESAFDSDSTESFQEDRQTLEQKGTLAMVVWHLENAPSNVAQKSSPPSLIGLRVSSAMGINVYNLAASAALPLYYQTSFMSQDCLSVSVTVTSEVTQIPLLRKTHPSGDHGAV